MVTQILQFSESNGISHWQKHGQRRLSRDSRGKVRYTLEIARLMLQAVSREIKWLLPSADTWAEKSLT